MQYKHYFTQQRNDCFNIYIFLYGTSLLPLKAWKQVWAARLHFITEQNLMLALLNAENKPGDFLSVCQSLLASIQTDLATLSLTAHLLWWTYLYYILFDEMDSVSCLSSSVNYIRNSWFLECFYDQHGIISNF